MTKTSRVGRRGKHDRAGFGFSAADNNIDAAAGKCCGGGDDVTVHRDFCPTFQRATRITYFLARLDERRFLRTPARVWNQVRAHLVCADAELVVLVVPRLTYGFLARSYRVRAGPDHVPRRLLRGTCIAFR